MTGQELYDSHQPGDCPDVLLWGTDRDGVVWSGDRAMILTLQGCLKAYAMEDKDKPEQRIGYFHDLAAVQVELADHDYLRGK